MLITLKFDTKYGEIQIQGQDAHEIGEGLQRLDGASDIYAALGRVHAAFNAETSSVNAQATAGAVLGATQIESAQPYTWESGIKVMSPQGVVDAMRYEQDGRRAFWYGSDGNLPITEDPNDEGLVRGTKRFWKWL